MGAVTFFEERLRGSDWGEPTDRDRTGFDVRILEFEGYVHLEMKPAQSESEDTRYVALFSLNEARQFLDALEAAISRVRPLGER